MSTFRRHASLVATMMLLLAATTLVGGCGNGDDGSKDDRASTRTTSDDADDDAEHEDADDAGHGGEDADADPSPTPMPDPVPEGDLPPVQLTAPTPFQELVGSFILEGTAQVHEGAIAWALLDAKLHPMASGRTTASCGAPCRGKFRIRIPLTGIPFGSWELHAWSPNVADEGPERLHDMMVPVTVTARRTAGAPKPGTIPPGGVPQG